MASVDSTSSASTQLAGRNHGKASPENPIMANSKVADAQGVRVASAAQRRLPLATSVLENQVTNKSQSQPVDKIASSGPLNDQENISPMNVLLRQLSEQTADKSKSPSVGLNLNELHAARCKPAEAGADTFDVVALKKQLAEAQQTIAQKDFELTQQQQAHKSLEQALSRPSSARLSPSSHSDQAPLGPGPVMGMPNWNLSQTQFDNQNGVSSMQDGTSGVNSNAMTDTSIGWMAPGSQGPGRAPFAPQPQRALNGRLDNLAGGPGFMMNAGQRAPRPNFSAAWGSNMGSVAGMSPPVTPMPSFPGTAVAGAQYQPRPIGPNHAMSGAHLGNAGLAGNPWNVSVSLNQPFHNRAVMFHYLRSVDADHQRQAQQLNPNAQHYVPPIEPINYRRLLDRNTSCDWGYIVEKIVCNNDQQASIFLQQKLKASTNEQKFELVEAIIAHAYPLMINRFGNFLIQRCFEHGTPEQVIAIANAIRGKTLDLSMDAFGCHVVQKAFDVVPEEYKALMVHELLRRIPETVVHRYACHVWQKLFELRWSESPPQIMKYVNEALQGMWHEVALGETGSLVVQNIFENCLEEDKRPCIEEVLSSIDIVAHGQFGNWCIQHVCEHGAPADKCRAVEQVLRYATEYSTDQFASKVVEKCLKVGGSEFLDRYLDKVCEGRADRPRMPLIDIAGDQYGNYLIQYVLINADGHHRELVAQHVRKHMVSLRGSKFGSRVAMLCTNPAIQTRPGPPSTMPVGNTPYYANASQVQPGYNPRAGFGAGRQDFR